MPPDRSPDAWLRRVDALLAKAVSTQLGPEADALIAKAHELVSRQSIDEAMLAQRALSDVGAQQVIAMTPSAGAKTSLLSAPARANGCRVVIRGTGRGPRPCLLIGHATDRQTTLAVYGWLVLHAESAMREAEVPSWEAPRRFRHAFLAAVEPAVTAVLPPVT